MNRTLVFAIALTVAAVPALAKPKPPRPPRPLGDPLPASDCAECRGGTPSLGGTTGADLMAAWDATPANGGDFRVYRRVVDANGNAAAVVQVSPDRQAGLTEVVGDGEGWLLGFFQPGSVFVQRLDGSGAALGQPLLVNEPSEGDSHGSALALRGDRAVATFDVRRADGSVDMVAQMLDGSLAKVGPRVTLGPASYRATSGVCIRPDGSAVVAWRPVVSFEPWQVALRLRVQGADSTLPGDVLELAPALAEGPAASVVCTGDGSFAVAWQSNLRPHAKNGWDPVWQWFDPAGRPRGPVAALNKAIKGDQRNPELLVLSDGSLLAVWESAEKRATTLRARRFSASGQPRGGELVLHRAAAGARLRPQLTLLPGTGRFALAWQERGQGWIRIFTE
jgi:hypothetical protein